MTGAFALAVHALVYLDHHRGTTISSEDLAENICTNSVRVRRTLTPFKNAGLVVTREGPGGGYTINCDPTEVTLAQIARLLDFSFVSGRWNSGGMDVECLIAAGMPEVMEDIYWELNEHCIESLEDTTLDDIKARIFKDE